MKARIVKALKLACCAAVAAHALAGTAHAADDAVARVSGYLAGVKTLSASFVQVVRDREGRITERATGALSIARPDRFRWLPTDHEPRLAQILERRGERLHVGDLACHQKL